MKRIMVLGMCPLPTENETHTLGPGKRTWQFTKSLLEDGHRVCLLCSRHLAAYHDSNLPPVKAEEHGTLVYYSLAQTIFENREWIQNLYDRFEPDCIIGATVYPSYVASQITGLAPFWADLFGHLMSEAQTKSFVYKDNYYIPQLWRFEKEVLDKADVFSVVSEPQGFATIGEIGARGRLNNITTGYSFTRIIPCAINDLSTMPDQEASPALRESLFEKDDFIILWSGGYNTWTDVKTLFKALEIVFSKNEKIKFVSTGGQINSHDEMTYADFREMINHSSYKNRFILKGWIPFSEVPSFWKAADVGINIDLFSYEAILGSRNRILDWMQSGLAVVTSELCSLSNLIKNKNLGFTFAPNNPEELASCLLFLSQNPHIVKEYAKRAQEFVNSELTISNTTRELKAWANNPCSAPDKNKPALRISDSISNNSGIFKHYLASMNNQIRTRGLRETARWMLARYMPSIIKSNPTSDN